jgi:hypothetical protein
MSIGPGAHPMTWCTLSHRIGIAGLRLSHVTSRLSCPISPIVLFLKKKYASVWKKMRKGKRGGDHLTRSFHNKRKALNTQSVVSGMLVFSLFC